MTYSLGVKSLSKLEGVHPDLVKVVKRAIEITDVDFTVLEGIRSVKRQKELFDLGHSKTMRSRHITGHAVDLGAYVERTVSWNQKWYDMIAKAMKESAKEMDVPIEWGGDWRHFKDSPHFQLPWKDYPEEG